MVILSQINLPNVHRNKLLMYKLLSDDWGNKMKRILKQQTNKQTKKKSARERRKEKGKEEHQLHIPCKSRACSLADL